MLMVIRLVVLAKATVDAGQRRDIESGISGSYLVALPIDREAAPSCPDA